MRFLTTVLLLLLAVSCRQAARDTVARADMLLSDQPDSALALLEGLDFHRLHGRRLRAHYALTHTVALDKNYIDSDNDSLFRYAFDYYSRHRDDSLRSLAHYYRGRLYQNGTQYRLATESYLTALHHLDTTRSHYRTGLVYSRLGEMYRDQYNFNSALDYFHRALDAYTSARAEVARYMTMGELGYAHYKLNNHHQAEDWYNQALQAATLHNDIGFIPYMYSYLLALQNAKGDYASALKFFDILRSEYPFNLSSYDYLILATTYLGLRDTNAAREAYCKAQNLQSDSDDDVLLNFVGFKLALSEGEIENISANATHYIHSSDSVMRVTLQTTIDAAERQFYAEQNAHNQYRLKVRNYGEVVIILLLLILAGFVFYLYRLQTKRREQKIYNYMAIAEELKKQYNDLGRKLQIKEGNEQLYKQALSSHFTLLDDLCLHFFERSTTALQQANIYKEVRTRLNSLANHEEVDEELNAIVNTLHNGVMNRLTEQLPKIKGVDLHFLRLLLAGFSPQVISLILEDSVHNMYARKNRIKMKIVRSDAPDKEEFLRLFD